MRDDGMDVQVLEKQCAQSTCSFPPKALSKATAAELKDKLGEMAVEDEESKKCFKELLSYFLVEQVLLCGRDAKKLRVRYWPLVENAELREKCNWAKATWNQLHTSIADLKTWSMKKATGQQTTVQHAFTGAAPILETIIYERIEKMRPRVYQIDTPIIQKYTAKRLSPEAWESEFKDLTSDDVAVCLHCTTCSSEGTLAISKDNASVTQEFAHLSLTPIPIGDLDSEMHQNEGGFLNSAVSHQGFCSIIDADANKPPLYSKVVNPTLAPHHLQDLPGFTRSVYKTDHALITPESHVFSPLPHWSNTLGAYLVSPAMGAHFVMYLAKMQESSRSGNPSQDVERFVFVLQGLVKLTNASGVGQALTVDSFAYIPPNSEHLFESYESATLVVFERRYAYLENHIPEPIVGSTDQQPLLDTPGEVFELRKLLPTSLPYDFNIHIMDFQPGEFLNVKEVHYNQHGLLLLEGQGIYRLGDSWYPVEAGDAIWMAPFVPQWYAALGKIPTRYLLYKDVNRDPL